MNEINTSEQDLLARVAKGRELGEPVDTVLKTNARVFARITDGIYREPASALRELIANAYDADATEVRIDTDAPRFSQMIIRDNGRGLTEAGLVHVISNIGGSLKRTTAGQKFQVTSEFDPTKSPSGRKLIGKLGIGLFSVSQLTHHLVIVTKVRGERVRRICDILLMPQKDVETSEIDETKEFVTGTAQITAIFAEDTESQGTEITLHDIRSHVRSELRSAQRWAALREEEARQAAIQRFIQGVPSTGDAELLDGYDDDDEDFRATPKAPTFHIGEIASSDSERLVQTAQLPWTTADTPRLRFEKLVNGVRTAPVNALKEKIKLSEILDNYLRMLWNISLSVPLPYVNRHPFSLTKADGIPIYTISNRSNGRAEPLELQGHESIATTLGFTNEESQNFSVIIDGVQICRPIFFPPTTYDDDKPLLFVGKLTSDLSTVPDNYRGGPIEFEAYLCWTKRVVPADHNGVMIRVHGASGILFDEHFLKYQVSEQTRLRQITAEIFIKRGLDAAQNIDRESFNVSHPHYQVVSNWLHHALRQLNTRHKSLQKTRSDFNLDLRQTNAKRELETIISSVSERRPSGQKASPIAFIDDSTIQKQIIENDSIGLDRTAVFASRSSTKPTTKNERLKEALFEEQIKAVATVLNEYGLLADLDKHTREQLIGAIVAIFSVEAKK